MSPRSQVASWREWISSPRFEVREHLGSGGAGLVFRAYDRQLTRDVALKVLHEGSARAVRAIRREFEALRSFSHPNLVGLGELFDDEDPPFFSMELIAGTDLCSYVRTGERYDEERLRASLAQLTRALRAMHRAGRVHRDIKPSNVRVTDEGRVVVLDLGLSVPALASSHELSDTAGTFAYMAPEQATGEIGPEVDFYALGVVLFECLTGRCPFEGSAERVMIDKQSRDAVAPSTLTEVPADLDNLCLQLLSHHPRERPSSAEVLALLEGARAGGPSSSASFMLGAVPMIERDAEVARALAACAERCAAGPDVFVMGTTGAGKSTLIGALARRLEASDPSLWVLRDRCEPRAWTPYQGISSVIRQLVERLKEWPPRSVAELAPSEAYLISDLFPSFKRLAAFSRLEEGARPPDAIERRWRAFVALRAFLQRLSERVTLVFVIDDLHWADGDTVQLLRALLEQTRDEVPRPRIRWLLSSEAPVPTGLDPSPCLIELAPLSARGVRELAEELLDPGTREDFIDSCVIAEHGALARHAVETLRHVLFFGTSSVEDSVALDLMYQRRIEALDGAARQVVELLAIAGRPLAIGILTAASDLPSSEITAAIGLLRSAGLVEDARAFDERAIEIVSLLLRGLVLSRLEASAVSEWNLRLLTACQGTDQRTTATLLRYQLGTRHLEAARRTAMAAARSAEDVLAFEHAAHVYELASAAWDGEPDEEQRELLCAMAQVLSSAGQTSRAAYSYDRASEGAKVAEALELRRRAAELWLRSGHIEQGVTQLSALLSAVGVELPKTTNRALLSMVYQRARLSVRGLRFVRRASRQISARELTTIDVYWSVGSLLGLVDFVSGADFQTRAVHAALSAGEPKRVAKALCVEAAFTSGTEDAPRLRTRRMIEIASLLANELDDPYLHGLVQLAQSSLHIREIRFRQSADAAIAAERYFRERCTAVTWELGQVRQLAVLALMQTGALDELVSRANVYARESLDRGDLYGWTNIVTVGGFMTELLAHRADEAQRLVSDAMERWPRSSFHVQHFFELLALAQIDLYRGGPAALARIDGAWPQLKRSMLLRVPVVHSSALWLLGLSLLAACACQPGQVREHRVRIRKAAKELATVPVAHAEALAKLLTSQEALLAGDLTTARAHAARALEVVEACNVGILRERAMFLLGRISGGEEGRALEARALSSLSAYRVASSASYLRQALPALEGL